MSKTEKSALTRERGRSGIIFGAPALIFVILFLGIPILQALYYSMTKWNGLSATWIGPNTFINEFKNSFLKEGVQDNQLIVNTLRVNRKELLDMYNKIDISFDTFPYSGVEAVEVKMYAVTTQV